jgi:hypothetical protein
MTPKEILVLEMMETATDIIKWATHIQTIHDSDLTYQWAEEILDNEGETFSALRSAFSDYLFYLDPTKERKAL